MDSKGLNFIIGLFVVAGITSIFFTGLWLARKDTAEQTIPYVINFEESVAGLGVGSRVSYRGIRIGSVSEIGIDPDDPQYVRVLVNINERYPIHEGDVASLKLEGITGSSYIDIEGAERGSEILAGSPGTPALIPSRKSELEQLVQGLPRLVSEISTLVGRLNDMVDEQNREQLRAILTNVETVSGSLAEQSDSIGAVLDTADEAGTELVALSRSIQEVVVKLDSLMETVEETAGGASRFLDEDVATLVQEWRTTAASVRQLSDSARDILGANEDSLRHFSRQGLYEFTLFLQEARLLVAGLTRVVDRIESSGARFLLDQQHPEIEPQ